MPSFDIAQLETKLCASIAANRFGEAERLLQECVALHTPETHEALIAVLQKARAIALVERSIVAEHRSQVQQAVQYIGSTPTAIFAAEG